MAKKSSKPVVPAAQRAAHALDLLAKGARPTQAARAVAQAFSVTERTAWSDVKVGQDQLAAAFAEDLPHVKAKLWSYYSGLMVLADEIQDVRGGVAAALALAKLCGADAPQKVETTVATGPVMIVPARPATPEEWAEAASRTRA